MRSLQSSHITGGPPRRVLVAVFGCWLFAAMLLQALPVSAHATLISTTPTSNQVVDGVPGSVSLQFDEPVEALEGGVRVFGPAGDRVDAGRIEVRDGGLTLVAALDGDERGTYTVAWRVLSEDGHNLSGSFVFHAGQQTGAVDVVESDDRAAEAAGVIGRFLAFAGSIVTVGAVLLVGLARFDPPLTRRLTLLVIVMALAGSAGMVLVMVAQAADASGRSMADALTLTWDVTSGTRTGVLNAIRASLLVGSAVIAVAALRWRVALLVSAACALRSMTTITLAGHAWTAPERYLALLSDLAHLVAAGAWIGGVVGLAVSLSVAKEPDSLIRRFSAAALVVAIVVGLTGALSALIQVRSVEALGSTSYGRLVLAKLVGFVALLALGWLNRTRLIQLVNRSTRPLLRSLRAEVAVAVAILAITAVLVDQPPARVEVGAPFTRTTRSGDVTLSMSVEPAQVGANDIHLYFFDAAGTAPADIDAVQATATTGEIPPLRLPITPVTGSHWSAYGASLTAPGLWSLEITTVRAGQPTTFTVEVPIR